jgi:hypothetical protein
MNIKKISLIVLLIFSILPYEGSSQDFTSVLSEKLTTFYRINVPVKLHLFFNQPEYAPGDTAWFSASYLTAHNYRGIGGRMIINMDLVDEKGKIVTHQKIGVHNGFGHSQLPFSPTLKAGIYTVVAYNDWMKNYDSSFFFYKKIAIAHRSNGPHAIKTIKVFPEGGSLIAGVQNKVVVTGNPGAEISLRNRGGWPETRCRVDSAGFGVLYITPSSDEEYSVSDNTGRKTKLMRAVNDKVALMVTVPERTKPIRVVMQITEGAPTLRDNFDIVLSNHDIIEYSARVRFDSRNVSVITIPQENLLPGISRLTIFRNQQHVAAERLIFVPPVSEPQVKISLDKEVYQPREKVTVTIRATNSSGVAVDSKLSCTVTAGDTFTKSGRENSLSEMLYLRGDLPVGQAMNMINTNSNVLDNYLITETWRRFSWEDVLYGAKKKTIPFARELFLTGKVKRINNNKPFPDSTLIAFFLPHNNQTYFEYLDAEGSFDLPLSFDFFNVEDVFYKVVTRNREVGDVVVELPSRGNYGRLINLSQQTDQRPTRYSEFKKRKNEIDRAYNTSRNFKSSVNNNRSIEELFTADFSVNLRDYLLFPTMEETLREVVPALERRVKQGKSVVRMIRSELGAVPDHDPIYFIDGVLTDNTEYFLSLNPKDVSTIKIINTLEKLQKLGPVGINGVVLVETLIANNADNVPVASASFKATGLNQELTFSQGRNTSAGRTRIPKLATALYWNPEIATSGQREFTFSFFTPDNTGLFTIQVSGITSEGEPVFAEKSFETGFNPPK